jgi:hypothetical protein
MAVDAAAAAATVAAVAVEAMATGMSYLTLNSSLTFDAARI